MKEINVMNYIAPQMEVVNIEVEQPILSSSGTIEELGQLLDEMGWK